MSPGVSVSSLDSMDDISQTKGFVPNQAQIFDARNKPGNSMFKVGQTNKKQLNSKPTIEVIGVPGTKKEDSTNLPTPDNPNAWKNTEDPLMMYQLEKYLKIGNIVNEEINELTRWKQADLKGSRETYYSKQVVFDTDLILIPVEQSRLEKLQHYEDRWPLLYLRKTIMKIAIYINIVAVKIASHKAFEYTSIGIILLNCIQLATENVVNQERHFMMKVIEYFFLAAYTLEMIIKILARGFVFNEGAYLRDSFNILDFVIVLSAYLTIITTGHDETTSSTGKKKGGVSLNALRAFRVLRPLRSITAIKGLRILVLSLLSALPLLKDTIVILFFFLLIFAIAGIQLISGNLKNRCIDIYTGRMVIDEDVNLSLGLSDGGILCGSYSCPPGPYFCGKMNSNPDNGVTNFDNILWALMMTFQNITLEGWSDTMKYYEMTSGIVIIVFFISSVFIGAFFLLNLTLAVINSSFSRMNEKYQIQAAEEKERKKKLIKQETKNDDEDDQILPPIPDEEENNQQMFRVQIGLHEYFVAKRAIKKMIDFYRRRKEERKRIEAEEELIRQKEEEQMELEGKQKRETKELKNYSSQEKATKSKRQEMKEQIRKQLIELKAKERLEQNPRRKGVWYNPNQAQVIEEAVTPHEEMIASRLQKLEDFRQIIEANALRVQMDDIRKEDSDKKIGKLSKLFPQNKVHPVSVEELGSKTLDKNFATVQSESQNQGNIIAEDSSEAERINLHKQVTKFLQEIESNSEDEQIEGSLSLPKAAKRRGTRMSRQPPASASKLKGFLEEATPDLPISRSLLPLALEGVDDKQAFLDNLALDKVIAEEHLQPQNKQTTKRASDDKNSGDKSLTDHSWDYPHYQTDDDARDKNRLTSLIDDDHSAISSDSSFNREIAEMEAQANEKNRCKVKNMQHAAFKEARKRYRKQSTFEHEHKKKPNDATRLSTYYNESIGIAKEKDDEEVKHKETKKVKKEKTLPQEDWNRVHIADSYKLIDDKFLNLKKPKNPFDYIDRRRKKIEINPGAKYMSSSAFEILEPRQFAVWQKHKEGKKSSYQRANRFLKPLKFIEVDTYQDEYIEPLYEAHQLKTRYEIKNVEQIDFDSDDEDNLILAIQPYDTVMNVGYKHHLSHMQVKFLTRRSDIIVSSTMSITLTPQDNDYVPKNTSGFNEKEINEWVTLRHEYRSNFITQAKLFGVEGHDVTILNKTPSIFDRTHSDVPPEVLNGGSDYLSQKTMKQLLVHSKTEYEKGKEIVGDPPKSDRDEGDGEEIPSVEAAIKNWQKRKLPSSGLSKQLTPQEIALLDEDQKMTYRKWVGKYDGALKAYRERQKKGVRINYTLNDAQKMLEGTYHMDENDDESKLMSKEKQEQGGQTAQFLNRSNITSDVNLHGFEQQIAKMLEEEKIQIQIAKDLKWEQMNKRDEVSNEIRTEFDLPENIQDNKVDFTEVIRSDAARKRKTPIWSGQDVLCVSYNRDHSEAVTSRMSTLRVWPKGFAGVLKRLRFLLKTFIMSNLMDNFMTLAVLMNTVVMALDRYGVKESEDRITTKINQCFTFLFITEFGLKIIAIGPKKYVDNRMNLLDGSVVMLSLLELAMGSGGKGALSAFRSVRVFRMFRVLRVARILRSLQSMQNIISVISRSASSFAYIAVLLIIFLFIYALLGMQIFGGKFNFDEGIPRGNYDTFNAAFLTAFQTLTMENWNSLLYDAIRSNVIKFISCAYYISWIFVGNFILLNLFLAILLDSFLEEGEEEENSEEALAAQRAAEELRKRKIKLEKERRLRKLGQSVLLKSNQHLISSPVVKKVARKREGMPDELIDDIDDLEEEQLKNYLVELNFLRQEKHQIKPVTFIDAEIECERSLYLFSQQNAFRTALLRTYKTQHFDRFVMALIVLSSIKLAADSYVVEQVKQKQGAVYLGSYYLDVFFTAMFTIEMLIKIVVMGFFMDTGSYLRESWNQLDFFIVITSLIDLSLTGKSLASIKVIRILRILRPLRFISHNQAMKLIVSALLDSGGSMLNVAIVIMIVWLMFAILAINLFSGKFFYCSEGMYIYHSKTDCLAAGHKWLRYYSNFDSAPEAMKSLFIIATFEGWPDIMHQAVDATGIDQGPEFEHQIFYGYFFVVFILIGSFFFVNFLVGVLFLKYTQAQHEEQKNFTSEQLNWIDIQKMIEKAEVSHEYRYKPRGPGSELQYRVWRIVNNDWFNGVVMAAIMLNMVQMACSYDGNPVYWQKMLKIANYVFSAIFVFEALMKLYVYRRAYFYTAWNKFDFFVVTASILDVILDGFSVSNSKALKVAPQLARVLRVLRVSRVLRLAGKNEGLQALLMTIQMSVTSLLNVTLLLLLIFFMFSVLGVSLFQNVTSSDDVYTLQSMDPQYKNFATFHNGLILIFVISTGENWPLVMYDCGQTGANCGTTTCGSRFSLLYYFAFVLVVQKIMLNLFILVIIQQFEQYYVSEDNPIQKFKNNLVLFEKVWIEFTEQNEHVKIKERELGRFFRKLPLPIGIPGDIDQDDMLKQLLKLGIRSENGFIFFNELLYRCMRRQYGKFKLNRQMTIYEISTQFRLLKMRGTQEKASDADEQKILVSKLRQATFAFNPFLLSMFVKITFEKWNSLAKQGIEARRRKELLMDEGEQNSEDISDFELKFEMVSVAIEIEEEVYITSDEEDESDSEES